MPNRFDKKVAIVTGAGSGIGAAIARGLAAEGAVVVGVDVDETRLHNVERRIEIAGGLLVPVIADVTDPEAVEALTLWTDWIQSGQASQANLNANQQDVRDQFMAGTAAMMVNGTWQLNTLDEAGTPYAVVPLPAVDGGAAPGPLGGEFIEVVASGDDARQAKAAEFAGCIIEPTNLSAWTTGQSYIQPYADAAEQQAVDNPALVPWVEAVGAARGRTAELGAGYPDVSRALWTAMQEALTGSKTPQQALTDAQASVSS